MASYVRSEKAYYLFKPLLETVFEKAGFPNDFDLVDANDKFVEINRQLLEVSKKAPTRNTLRKYAGVYLGLIKFSILDEKLDVLCAFVEKKDWWSYYTANSGEKDIIKEPNRVVSAKELKRIKNEIAFRYKKNERFAKIEIVGDLYGKFGFLDIQKFYVDLVYIKKKDIDSSNSLLEKEKASYKKTLQNERLKVSEKLLGKVISNHRRLAVLGNPGVGKSTFSRYLCYKWALGQILHEELIVHIELKRLNFKKGNRCIAKYLNENYSKNLMHLWYEHQEVSEKLIFILDGFDEINDSNKQTLFNSLFHCFPNPRYILLTRPYGILNQSISFDGHLEIIGFNESTRLMYIERLLKKYGSDLKTDAILKAIEKNPLLLEFSLNPLMLSYLVVIAVNEGISEFNSFSSGYELQTKVSGWLERYHAAEKTSVEDYLTSIVKGSELALRMELDQEYVFERNLGSSKYDEITGILNKTGIGRKEQIDNAGNWRFYFSSATFQEFLAAKAVLNFIQPEQILMLLRNQLYWNFVQMIIGGLSLHFEEKALATLDYIQKEYKERENKNLFFLSIILLGEMSSKVIESRMNELLLKWVLESLREAYNNISWLTLIKAATTKIYTKLGFKDSAHFIEIFLDEIENEYKKSSEVIFNYFSDVGFELALYEHPSFLDLTMVKLKRFIYQYTILYELPNETLTEETETFQLSGEDFSSQSENLVEIIEILFAFIAKVFPDLLHGYEDFFKKLIKSIPDFDDKIQPIIDSFSSSSQTRKGYLDCLEEIEEKIESKYYENDDPQLTDKDSEIYPLAAKSLGLAKAYNTKDFLEKKEIEDEIFRGVNCARKVADVMTFSFELVIETFAEAINILQADNYITSITDLMFENEVEGWVRTDNITILEPIINEQLIQCEKKPLRWELLDKLCKTFGYFENSNYLIDIYLERIYIILTHILKTYNKELSDGYSQYLVGNTTYFHDLQPKKAVFKILYLLKFAHERYYFFIKLTKTDFINLEYVKYYIIPYLISTRISNTSSLVWHYIEVTSKKTNLENMLNMLKEEDLYLFRSNISRLDVLLIELKSKFSKIDTNTITTEVLNHVKYFYRIGFYITKAFISSKDLNSFEISTISILQKILLDSKLEVLQNSYWDSNWDVESYKLFPLNLYNLSGNEKIISSLSLPKKYSKLEGSVDFCKNALELYSSDQLKEMKHILSKDILEKIMKYNAENILFFQPIAKEELNKLLVLIEN